MQDRTPSQHQRTGFARLPLIFGRRAAKASSSLWARPEMFKEKPLGLFSETREEVAKSPHPIWLPDGVVPSSRNHTPTEARPSTLEPSGQRAATRAMGALSRLGKWVGSTHAVTIGIALALSVASVGEVLSSFGGEAGSDVLGYAATMKSCIPAMANSQVLNAMYYTVLYSLLGGACGLAANGFVEFVAFVSDLYDAIAGGRGVRTDDPGEWATSTRGRAVGVLVVQTCFLAVGLWALQRLVRLGLWFLKGLDVNEIMNWRTQIIVECAARFSP